MPTLFDTREAFLTEAAALILDERIMPAVGSEFPRPDFRISVGFPKHSRGGKSIAVCFVREVSTDNVNEIFINPEIDDPALVLECVAHELIHAVDNAASGHRGFFKRIATRIGLVGPMKSTTAGPELASYLASCLSLLGEYPHRRMDIDSAHKKGGSRMLKLECVHGCGFICRTTQKWVNEMTLPAACPACGNHSLDLN